MASHIAHERARDATSREVYSPVPSSPHTFNGGRPLSQHDEFVPSPMTGNSLSGEEPHTDPEMAAMGPTSVASLRATLSDATRSGSPIHSHGHSEPVCKLSATQNSNGYRLASDSEGSTEPHGQRLPSRTTIQRDFAWCLTWFCDILVTIIPLFFLGMTVTQFFLSFGGSPN